MLNFDVLSSVYEIDKTKRVNEEYNFEKNTKMEKIRIKRGT